MAEPVPRFTGEDLTYSSTTWAQNIEDNAEIFGWTSEQKLIIARRSLSGTAELWIRTEKPFKTYDELKTALQKEFPETINSKQMHELMCARKKRSNESYYQYMLIMKELGKRAKFPDYVAIQYIIDGIVDYEQNKIGLYGVTTYSALKEKLTHYETMKQKMKQQSHSGVSKPREKVAKASSKADQPSERSIYRCFNCGEKGHIASTCVKGTKCFKCNFFGHKATECRAGNIQNEVSRGRGLRSAVGSSAGGNGANIRSPQTSSMFVQQPEVTPEVGDNSQDRMSECDVSNVKSVVQFDRHHCQCQCQCQNNLNVLVHVNKAVINKSIKIVKVGNISVKCLVDTGSDINLISHDLYTMLSDVNSIVPEKLLLTGLGSSRVSSIGKFNCKLIVDGHCYNVTFHVVPKGVIPYPVILGQTFLTNTIMLIDKGVIQIKPHSYDSSFLQCLYSSIDKDELSPQIQSIIDSYKPLKIKEAPIKLKIILKDDIPVVQRPRRFALKEEEEVKQQIDEWLTGGIIRPSFSEYASPLVLVRKKDGSIRVCVDYRKINQKMVKDEYPLPVIDDHIDKLCKTGVFSTLDLKNGFFHLPIDEDSIKYTAFVTSNPEGQYEFLRAPFGLSICPKYFTRFINIIFADFIRRGILLIFIDDLIILAEDESQALQHLKDVLKVASEFGLEINWKKSQLLQESVEYLGHIISKGTVRPSKDKTDAVFKFPVPRNLKAVQSFIGLTSYFRKFIPDYARVARPLSDLLKTKEFYFGEDQKIAFEKLKQLLCSDPVLRIFDIQLETELHTDASKFGYAAVLMQKDATDGSMHPIHYMSRKTSDAQQKCSSYELEALAVVEGVKKFRKYLIGIPFKIVTDCEAFQKTLTKKEVSAKIARWIMYLQDFNYSIVHRKGERMQHVDALSRNICIVNTELHYRLKIAQEEDETLKVLKEILKEKEYEDYILENDIIYKGVEKKLVVPEGMDVEIIKMAHGMGHFGKKKVKDIVEKDYFICKLDQKIEKVISMCVPCILANRKLGKKEGLLSPIDKGELPLDTLHCDHVGPLDETKKMYKYILTVIDAYTKFVWIYPVKTLTSKETVDKLKLHQKDYGNPRRIITDRGTAFTGKEFVDYCAEEEIEHIKVTTGIPRGNGQVERMNQIIISVLAKLCIEEPVHWYKHVSRLQRVINSSYQRCINTSPFKLLTGVELKQKENIKIVELLEEENRIEFTGKREELRREAKIQILKLQEENRKSFNKSRKKGRIYNVGELVAIQRTQFGTNLKIKQKFFGPYKIIRKIGKDRYEVEKVVNSNEGPKKTTTAVDYMKRWL